MAIGDVKSDLQSISASSVLDILPGTNEEWEVNNLYYESTVDLELFKDSGSLTLTFDSRTGPEAVTNAVFKCTTGVRIRVQNTDGTAKLIGYDGTQTK
jgi:hypothetical protein